MRRLAYVEDDADLGDFTWSMRYHRLVEKSSACDSL